KVTPIQENFHRVFARNCDPDKADLDVDPAESFGLDLQKQDVDGVSRQFQSTYPDADGKPLPTLVARMLTRLGRPVWDGYIDYSIGDRVHYIPMHDVIAWYRAGDVGRLKRTFGGRIVLIGGMGGDRDRWPLPVKAIDLIEDAHQEPGRPNYNQPGVMI